MRNRELQLAVKQSVTSCVFVGGLPLTEMLSCLASVLSDVFIIDIVDNRQALQNSMSVLKQQLADRSIVQQFQVSL